MKNIFECLLFIIALIALIPIFLLLLPLVYMICLIDFIWCKIKGAF